MGEHRSCFTGNKIVDGTGGRVRRSLRLALLSAAAALLAVPMAYGASDRTASGVPFIAAHAAIGQQAGEERTAHLLDQLGQENAEPIAYIGHGGFFDQYGRQIVPTAEFVAKAQSWYRARLLAGMNAGQKAELAAFERRLGQDLKLGGQAGLRVKQRSLDWLLTHSPRSTATGRMQAKLNALKYRMNWTLPARDDLKLLLELEPFRLSPRVAARLSLPEFSPGGMKTATTNGGQAYINECIAAGVPIPPSIGVLDPNGTAGWRSLGFIPQAQQFIVGTKAEVRVFQSANGMCIALPRYVGSGVTTVQLDGVICLSQTTSKVCFWDNQMNNLGFQFPSGTQIPIGVPNLTVNAQGLYQSGGADIEFGDGGQCTDCHAGENPYIIHPDSNLGTVLMGDLNSSLGLPTFAPNKYDPLVGASWPQNQLSQAVIPSACIGCHTQAGSGGRLPHISNALPGYCTKVLAKALQFTMPLGSPPGSELNTPEVNTLQAWCGVAPNTGPSNRGDPHLTTTNGINYDFQAAGEFTSLRNSATGFELQTRQTPVLTTFTPGPNAYTGLASCVSLNTAAALRVGGHRISYQPTPTKAGTPDQMVLRIDDKATTLPASGSLSLGGNNRIARAAAGGGIDVRVDDGTRVIVTPNYWSSEGYWYLDVEVLNTPAREGTMGHILASNWLPLGPGGASFGPAPAGLPARHALLNGTFADAWRVSSSTSLFDYASGTSTASFTNRNWPPPPGTSCTSISGGFPWPGIETRSPVRPMDPESARRLCSPIANDATALDNCIFDLTVTGNAAMANGYQTTLHLRTLP
jgi:hypothetical protein